MIKLYNAQAVSFQNNGLGNLNASKCTEVKRLGLAGWYLTIDAMISAENANYLQQGTQIKAPTFEKGDQIFIATNPEKNSGKISVLAPHRALFLMDRYFIPSLEFAGKTASEALSLISAATDRTCPVALSYSGSSTVTKDYVFEYVSLFDALKTIEDLYGIRADIDGLNIVFRDPSYFSADSYRITYGGNLTSFKISEKYDEVCNRIIPYDGELTLPEVALTDSQTPFSTVYSRPVEFDIPEDGYTTAQRQSLLRSAARAYMTAHRYPQVDYQLSAYIRQGDALKAGQTVIVSHPDIDFGGYVSRILDGYEYDLTTLKIKNLYFGSGEVSLIDSIRKAAGTDLKDSNGNSINASDVIKDGVTEADVKALIDGSKLPITFSGSDGTTEMILEEGGSKNPIYVVGQNGGQLVINLVDTSLGELATRTTITIGEASSTMAADGLKILIINREGGTSGGYRNHSAALEMGNGKITLTADQGVWVNGTQIG